MNQIRGRLTSASDSLNGTLAGYVIQGSTDHSKLTGRDLPDQHPMEAVTGLIEYINALEQGFVLYCGDASEVI